MAQKKHKKQSAPIENKNRNVQTMEFHPLANIFPMIGGKDFENLVASIKEKGQQLPIITYEGKILDGRNRYRACVKLDKKPIYEEYKGSDPTGYVISVNVERRHLEKAQRAWIAAKLLSEMKKTYTQKDLERMLHVSERLIRNAVAAQDNAAPELEEAVQKCIIGTALAEKISALEQEAQKTLVAMPKPQMLKALRQTSKRDSNIVSRPHIISLSFTAKEMNMIDAAKRRQNCTDTNEVFLREIIMDACDERHLFPTKTEIKKMTKQRKLTDPNYDPGMEDRGM